MAAFRNWSALQLVTLALAGQSVAISIPYWARVIQRDVFNVGTYASLGESFASGPSAGDPYDDVKKCRRYTEAFGPQVSRSDDIQGPKPMKFSFIACSGSRTKHIYEGRDTSELSSGGGGKPTDSQASQLKDMNPDMVTISIGGNDVGFVDLLDRCVYRFKDPSCKGCTPSFSFDDCTNDCQAAIDAVSAKIASDDFKTGLQSSVKAIWDNAAKTKIFFTGYPAFWNHDSAACDKVSFKFACIEKSVLPLIRDRRLKMNKLTDALNDKIKEVIDGYRPPAPASIHFVDTNPFFDKHRFCEEGVKEPSYRNPNIYFYPFEYTTGNTFVANADEIPSGDCQALYDNGGDAGDFFGCEIANAIKGGASIDFGTLPNNVPGDGDVAIQSSDGLPDFLARIFHPTKAGMTAYKDAIVSAYKAVPAAAQTATPPPSGPVIKDPKCAGAVGSTRYAAQKTVDGNIPDFCSQAAKQGVQDPGSGSLGRKFNAGTNEELTMAMDWPSGMKFTLDEKECNNRLLIISAGCDGNDPDNNPMDWKAGGSLEAVMPEGTVTYRITMSVDRQPLTKQTWTKCDMSYQFPAPFNWFGIGGAGWEGSNWGKDLRDNLNGCSQTMWKFSYGTGDDGREWSAEGHVPFGKKGCVQDAIKSSGGPEVSCSGSGLGL